MAASRSMICQPMRRQPAPLRSTPSIGNDKSISPHVWSRVTLGQAHSR
jgi:hypothetical protein